MTPRTNSSPSKCFSRLRRSGVTSITAHAARPPHNGLRFPDEVRNVSRTHIHVDESSCQRRHCFILRLTDGRAPGLEQKHAFPTDDRIGILGRVWLRGCVGRSASSPDSLRTWRRQRESVENQTIPSSLASAFHLLSTSAFVFASITISSGQGRVNPSLAHLRVASIPIFEP